jgi:putative colanic acid biosynthesis UDP-glucose lipid carrier transferase
LFDAVAAVFVLHLTIRWFGESWNFEYAGIAALFVVLFESTTSSWKSSHPRRVRRVRHELFNLVSCWIVSSALVISSVSILLGFEGVIGRVVLVWLVGSLAVIAPYRIGVRLFLRSARYFGYDARKVGFVGANEVTAKLHRVFETHPWAGMRVMGVFDDRRSSDDRVSPYPAADLAGRVSDLVQLARTGDVDIIYITFPMAAEKRIKQVIDDLSDATTSIYYCPSLFNFELMNARSADVFGQAVISVIESPFVGHNALIKRLEDWLLLLVLFPFVCLLVVPIAVGVAVSSSGPVFFRQSRYGLDGKRFVMWKFRTMYVDNCQEGFLQAKPNDPRVTRLGRFLRATSLDELPQFLNVLRGEMSIVGPRPHPDVVNEELRERIYRYMIRHKVRPGITGLAQVSGFRGETETPEKMEKRIAYDLEYIKSWSVWLDLKILFRTVFAFRGKNVY